MNDLYGQNSIDSFWRPLDPIPEEVWQDAVSKVVDILPGELVQNANGDVNRIIQSTLSESLFGENRYTFSPLKTIYYAIARPILPTWFRPLLRKFYEPEEDVRSVLGWPTEKRFAQFQFNLVSRVLSALDRQFIQIVGFWPDSKKFSFVLTHDVEAQTGHDFVRKVMDLEEKYGFRSSFNFVPEGYEIDPMLLEEIINRGFEIGVHGLKHDGRLFFSHEIFEERAKLINHYLSEWGAQGYRSPLTHRNPEWMQSLEIQYDLSFFDTDPYEAMAGGTMSIWPFFIGRFIELPYTLMQDHRYLEVLEQDTPELWLKKVKFIEAYHGMVLLNSHPDYLLKARGMEVYERLLAAMKQKVDCWHALPRDVAEWWRKRTTASLDQLTLSEGNIWTLEKQSMGEIKIRIGQRELE